MSYSDNVHHCYAFTQAGGPSRKSQKSSESNGVATLSPELMQLKNMREADRQEKDGIVLWKRPFTTLHYFIAELCLSIQEYALKYVLTKVSHNY